MRFALKYAFFTPAPARHQRLSVDKSRLVALPDNEDSSFRLVRFSGTDPRFWA
jgi:hypothetical protein